MKLNRVPKATSLACEFCHTKGEGKCVQKDDMEKVMPAYLESDMIVFASPIYYFGMSSQTMTAYTGLQDMGIVTASAADGGAEPKLAEITELAKSL